LKASSSCIEARGSPSKSGRYGGPKSSVAKEYTSKKKFSDEALELKNPKNQIDCRQPLRKGLVMLGALSFGASVSMLLQGGYGYGNDL
jgi:hypothetical protein